MRVTIRKIKGKEYVYVHESYRDPETGKPKHRTLESFGRLDLQLEKDPEFLNKLYARVEELNRQEEEQELIQEKVQSFGNILKDESSWDACYLFSYGSFLYRRAYQMILPFSQMDWLSPGIRICCPISIPSIFITRESR